MCVLSKRVSGFDREEEVARRNTHSRTQHPLQQHTLVTLGAASALLGDGQGARRAGGAGTQITSHLGITAFTLPAITISPSSQVLKKERNGRETGRENRGERIYQTYM